ncbi:MAG: nucleotidyl transferase AbiEii/AbiGii toxin family protein [Deltaproteobacteria bacterium]|nr:nucleotidyl transferase AbiEii/AbiGii toxin family protein [Deltaproteobacteria bacterium]
MAGATELAPAQRRALARLRRLASLRGFYLAGGSAVAFHLRHRRSNDLDLFSPGAEVDLSAVSDDLARLPDLAVVSATDAVLRVRLGRVALDVVRYRYPPLRRPSAGPEGFPVAGLLDLATMKLAAISVRGIRRDFWDLHEILTRTSVTLGRSLDGYVSRYGVKQADLYHVLRALTYFDDAEKEPAPRGLGVSRWRAIKEYFSERAPEALRRRT